MGVCEGSPRSIFPDHMGRADYHGASINQAARFMDAGKSKRLAQIHTYHASTCLICLFETIMEM
jgi:hypothetical protein